VTNEYATTAGRYYHSNLPSYFEALDDDLLRLPMGQIDVTAWPFESKLYLNYYGIKSIMIGLCWTFKEKQDLKVVEDLRTFREHKMDLAAMDLFRSEVFFNSKSIQFIKGSRNLCLQLYSLHLWSLT